MMDSKPHVLAKWAIPPTEVVPSRTRTLYQLVRSQFVLKLTAGPSQLKYSRTAVPRLLEIYLKATTVIRYWNANPQ